MNEKDAFIFVRRTRRMPASVGTSRFDGSSTTYATRAVEWHLPDGGYFFEVDRNASVRTAGVLARRLPEALEAIRVAVDNGVKQFARGKHFVLPMAAHVVAVLKA